MAMTANDLGDAIYTAMQAEYWSQPLPPDAEAETRKYYRTIAKGVLAYITVSSQVLPGTFQAVVPGVGTIPVTGVGGPVQ